MGICFSFGERLSTLSLSNEFGDTGGDEQIAPVPTPSIFSGRP